VDPIVQGMPAVSGHLVPRHAMAPGQGDQRLPEVAVLHGLLLGIHPAVPLPALVPAVAEAVDEVGAVAVESDRPLAVDSVEPFARSGELHALAGGEALAAPRLDLPAVVDHDGGPAARPGVAGTGAVGVDADGVRCAQIGRLRPPSRDSGRRTRSGSARSAGGAPGGAGV